MRRQNRRGPSTRLQNLRVHAPLVCHVRSTQRPYCIANLPGKTDVVFPKATARTTNPRVKRCTATTQTNLMPTGTTLSDRTMVSSESGTASEDEKDRTKEENVISSASEYIVCR